MTDAASGQRVVMCIVTRGRPTSLARAIRSLAEVECEVERVLLVVDNDPDGSARAACDAMQDDGLPFDLRYVIEPEPGIPFARNRAVDEALALDADFVVFFDDDETAERTWLRRLLEMQASTGAAVITGPALPVFGDDCPTWVVEGGYFEPARFPTGTERDRAYTNNVLVRADVFRDGLRFDRRMRMTGGSDTHLFRTAHRAGHRIVWVDDAVTREVIPSSRATMPWILKRAYRLGTTTAFMTRELSGALRGRLSMLVLGAYRVLKGAVLLPFTLPGGRKRWVWNARHVTYGAGMIAGSLGVRYDEYTRTHGS